MRPFCTIWFHPKATYSLVRTKSESQRVVIVGVIVVQIAAIRVHEVVIVTPVRRAQLTQ